MGEKTALFVLSAEIYEYIEPRFLPDRRRSSLAVEVV